MKGRVEGREGTPLPPPQILLAPSFLAACVTEVLLLVSHCPLCLSPCLPGWGLVMRHPTSWQAGRQEKEEE